MPTSLRIGAALLIVLAACTSSAPGRMAAQAGTRPPAVPVAPAYGQGAVALAEEVAGTGNTMRVLMIGAHPDDEDPRDPQLDQMIDCSSE